MELLVTTKDPETKTKAFEKCLDVIKGAGVSSMRKEEHRNRGCSRAEFRSTEESRNPPQGHRDRSLRRRLETRLCRHLQGCRGG